MTDDDDDKQVTDWIEAQADRFLAHPVTGESPDREIQESMARLLVDEFLNRFDAAWAESVVQIARNYAMVSGFLEEKVREGVLRKDDRGHWIKNYKQ